PTRTKISTPAVSPLPPEAVTHREQCARFARENAAPWHRTHLGRLYELWEEWNRAYFAGRLVAPPYIFLTEPAHSHSYGDFSNVSAIGGWAQIRIRPSLLTGTHPHVRPGPEFMNGRFLVVADVLLHEMIHQCQYEVTGKDEAHRRGHGP